MDNLALNLGMNTSQVTRMQVETTDLSKMRQSAHQNPKQALVDAAHQFESLFMNQLMKSMRATQFDDDNLMNSEQTRFFQGMQDEKLVQELSSKGNLGVADKIIEQFMPSLQNQRGQMSSQQQLELRQVAQKGSVR